jgi:hypothetical protein
MDNKSNEIWLNLKHFLGNRKSLNHFIIKTSIKQPLKAFFFTSMQTNKLFANKNLIYKMFSM